LIACRVRRAQPTLPSPDAAVFLGPAGTPNARIALPLATRQDLWLGTLGSGPPGWAKVRIGEYTLIWIASGFADHTLRIDTRDRQ